MFPTVLRSALLFVCLVLAAVVQAQTTVTLQDGLSGYTGTADNWIVANSGANINRGADVNVAIRAVSDYGIWRFPIFAAEGGPVPDGATISSATLSLYKAYGPDAVMRAQRLTKAWTEMGSTWNSTGTVNWTTPGGDVVATADGQASVPDSEVNNCADGIGHEICWLNINVTSGVQSFAANPGTNFGWRVSAVSSSEEFTPKNFNSRNITNFPQYRPKLTVTYTTGPAGCNTGALRPYDGAPINGNPIAIAASGATTFEAEHFNCGGQDVAYHDNVAGNNGGAFRPNEDVDIIASTDPAGGGYVIQNFYTGEWLTYTINVAQAGTYDLAIRASADNPGSFHFEIDGVDVTGNVPVPNTGSLNNYVWVTKAGVNLAAGQHVLRLVSDQQFFWPNQLRFTPSTGCTPPTASLNATPSSGAAPLNVSFSASGSSDGSSPITSLTLNFGDASAPVTWTDKNQAQAHTYNASSVASLTATNACGTSAPATQQITVGGTFPSPLPASGVGVGTFHSMGLYYNPPNGAPSGNRVFVRYRLASEDPNAPGFTWRQGHEIWYDGRGLHNYAARGSVVHLQPATPYIFELGVGTDYASAAWERHIAATTWSESFPVGTTLTPWTGTKTTWTSSFFLGSRSSSSRQHVFYANQSGTPTGYTLYDFTGANAVAQTQNASGWFPVVVRGSYIIIRGLKTVGGESGIFIDPGSHDIVIENCEITSYGRDSGTALGSGLSGNRAVNEDGGIKFPDPSYGPNLETRRIVIQRNRIHNPAFGSNPWDGDHPFGAAPITMYPVGGEIVIRYNAAYSTTNGQMDGPPDLNHFHMDGLILGGENAQGIGADVDVYKNIVMHYFDDGLETDGDGINNRVWKNYFDYGGASAVSTTATYRGPTYVWRNVYNRARMFITDPWGNERDRIYMLKSGGVGVNGGRRYLYHNTSMQPPASSEGAPGPNPLGAGYGAGGTGGTTNGMQNTVSRNNVFWAWKATESTFHLTGASGNDLDYDLSNAQFTETHGIHATPQFQTGNGWSSYWNGAYRLQAGTPGHDDGTFIPNFSDGFVGTAPDMGAHEDGTPNMQFGPTASGS